MRFPQRPTVTWQRGILVLLALWSMVLMGETWNRRPGSILTAPDPPASIRVGDALYLRSGKPLAGRTSKAIPTATVLVRHWMFRYRLRSGAATAGLPPEFLLARIQVSGGGRAQRLPLRRIQAWMTGPQRLSTSGCLAPAGSATPFLAGRYAGEKTTEARGLMKAGNIPWLLGLQPIEEASCLWMGYRGPLHNQLQRTVAKSLTP